MNPAKLTPIYQATDTDDSWQTADDRVMGGVSIATLTSRQLDGSPCRCLTGSVSLENRGGFVQMKWPINDRDASAYTGVYVDAWGNNEDYNIHVRTAQLWLPWQSFRQTFHATPIWTTHFLPFNRFENYKTWSSLDASSISKIAVVAIGRAFQADICVRAWGFYSV